MPSQPTGKWPRLQFIVFCKTCNKTIKFSINYGQSNIWSETAASKMAAWSEHDTHDVEVQYEFFAGRNPKPKYSMNNE